MELCPGYIDEESGGYDVLNCRGFKGWIYLEKFFFEITLAIHLGSMIYYYSGRLLGK
ncbi:hypothetical protein J22TS3_44620 [Paenibacillus sp. J22TS3]|nr:hypothetical protein J22TS3_44620 [Paenibacillus sp. J22TS3]